MAVAVRVIPCLDVDAGRVVKGVNFEHLRDAGDPVELARRYNAAGADELTFLDVTASTADRATTYEVVTRTAEEVFIPLTVGGGVRTVEDVDRLLRVGADKASINTAAVTRPEVINEITRRLGWTSENYPKNLFRRHFGLSMKAYRDNCAKSGLTPPATAPIFAPSSWKRGLRSPWQIVL